MCHRLTKVILRLRSWISHIWELAYSQVKGADVFKPESISCLFSWKLQRKKGMCFPGSTSIFRRNIVVDVCVYDVWHSQSEQLRYWTMLTHSVLHIMRKLCLSLLSPACAPGAYQNYLVCISNGRQRNIFGIHMSCSAGGAFVCGIYSRSTLSPSLFVRFDLQFTNTRASIAACPFGCHSRHPQFLFACHADVQKVPRHDSTREFRHRARFYLHPTRCTYMYTYRPDKWVI
jgi:hypothetical protein